MRTCCTRSPTTPRISATRTPAQASETAIARSRRRSLCRWNRAPPCAADAEAAAQPDGAELGRPPAHAATRSSTRSLALRARGFAGSRRRWPRWARARGGRTRPPAQGTGMIASRCDPLLSETRSRRVSRRARAATPPAEGPPSMPAFRRSRPSGSPGRSGSRRAAAAATRRAAPRPSRRRRDPPSARAARAAADRRCARAMRRAWRSSPYSKMMRASSSTGSRFSRSAAVGPAVGSKRMSSSSSPWNEKPRPDSSS